MTSLDALDLEFKSNDFKRYVVLAVGAEAHDASQSYKLTVLPRQARKVEYSPGAGIVTDYLVGREKDLKGAWPHERVGQKYKIWIELTANNRLALKGACHQIHEGGSYRPKKPYSSPPGQSTISEESLVPGNWVEGLLGTYCFIRVKLLAQKDESISLAEMNALDLIAQGKAPI